MLRRERPGICNSTDGNARGISFFIFHLISARLSLWLSDPRSPLTPGRPARPLSPSDHQRCTRTNSVRRISLPPSSPRTTNQQILIRTFSMANPSRIPRTSRSHCHPPTNNKISPCKTTAILTSCGSSNSKSSSCNSCTSYNSRYSSSRFVVVASPNLFSTHEGAVDGNTERNPASCTIYPDAQP